MNSHQDYIVACVIATEVPPHPVGTFTALMIPLAIQAVCDVIRNRHASPDFPDTAVEVVLQPRQFSAVCAQDYWRKAMAGIWAPDHVQRCLEIWCAPRAQVVPKATHYFSPVSMVPVGRTPGWIQEMVDVPLVGMDQHYFKFYRKA